MTKRTVTAFMMLMMSIVVMAQTLETDPVLNVMRDEMNREFQQLKQKPVPAYFMSLRLQDITSLNISSYFGVGNVKANHTRGIAPIVRLGDKELDNYKFLNQGTENPYSRSEELKEVPLDGKWTAAYRDEIWQQTLSRYNIAVKNYEEAKAMNNTDAAQEDKAPCFTDAPRETYYEPELPEWKLDTAGLKAMFDRVSTVFKACRLLEYGMVSCYFETTRTYIVNTDGTQVVQNRRSFRVKLDGSIKATDGMACPLHQDFFGYNEADMPSEETLMAAAKDLVSRLLALREAPIADPYTGPAILSGSAAGVFFHEIFGHRLESHRLKQGGETFKKMVGQRVLPTTFNVFCDPTLQYYGVNKLPNHAKQALNGYYLYDEEGTRGQRVQNVENGILKSFLLGRTPIEGFLKSNGHGRAAQGNDPVSRQSNLIIETMQPYTDAQLRDMLIKEAKKQGKEYGYFFRSVESGVTYTYNLNSFNVDPLEVYRVYVDGRNDELVRGVGLIGTPLSMFSNIEAGGATPETFTGQCGDASGWVNVTATAPMIFVSKVETQRNNAEKNVPVILSLPAYKNRVAENEAKAKDVIFDALEDEMQRTRDSLHLADLPLPFYVDYKVRRGAETSVSASLGGVYRCSTEPVYSAGSAHMVLGDYDVTSQLEPNHRGEQVAMGQPIDYDLMRRQLWGMSDLLYKYNLNFYAQKMQRLKKNPLPEEDQQVPEMLKMPAVESIQPTCLDRMPDVDGLKKFASELSAIFLDYPKIYNSDATITTSNFDLYRVNSEGIKIRMPQPSAVLKVNAHIKSADGSDMKDELTVATYYAEQWPSLDELKKRVRDFCELMVKKSEAPAIKEYYVGPMMLEDESVNEAFLSVVKDNCEAKRDMYKGSDINSMKLGKRILDTKLSIHQLTDTPEYEGQPLYANYTMDVDGVMPQKDLAIVDHGLMKNMLCGRRPAVGAMQSTGNELLEYNSPFSSCIAGPIRVTCDGAVPMSKMKALLLKEAKKDGLDHTYIIKAPRYGWRYLVRVDVKTGAEEIVREKIIPQPSRGSLMHVVAASKENFVANKLRNNDGSNGIMSAICPKAIIVETMEFSFKKPDRTEDFLISRPE